MGGVNPALVVIFVSCLSPLVTETASVTETSLVQATFKQVRQFTYYGAVLKCTIGNKSVEEITWLKKGKVVKADSRHTIVKSANNTARSTSLKIKSLELTDYGEYTCLATISGKNHSDTVKLLQKKKDSVVRPLEKVIKRELNTNASLKCLLPPKSTNINWLKNGIAVKSDSRREVIRSDTDKYRSTTLNIKSIEKADYGTYTCSGNISGKVISSEIHLTDKKGIPHVEPAKAEITEALGSNVILKCNLAKNPTSVSWSKNGTKLKSDDHRTIVKYTNKKSKLIATSLNFKKLVADDFGTYECQSIVSGKTYSASIKLVEKK